MRLFIASLLCVLLTVAAGQAQPQHGEVVLAMAQLTSGGSVQLGYVLCVDPAQPQNPRTLATTAGGLFFDWVRMDPDNNDLVLSLAHASSWTTSHMVRVDPQGATTTVATLPRRTDGFELDHDGQWVAVVRDGSSGYKSNLLAVDHATGSIRTLASYNSSQISFNEVAIDRDPGGPEYAIGTNYYSWGKVGPVLSANRQGVLQTVSTGTLDITSIELHPRSGDYVVTEYELSADRASRVNKAGQVTPIVSSSSYLNGARIAQDDTVWISGSVHGSADQLMRYDLTAGAMVTILPMSYSKYDAPTSVELYGSRPLLCRQEAAPSCTVHVTLSSRHPGAGGRPYALAASLARRPGLKMGNGQWLDLEPDALFYLTVSNLAPAVLVGFQGNLDLAGRASARVDFPPPLSGSGLTVFVAGVVFDAQGVVEVTNTHWFVL